MQRFNLFHQGLEDFLVDDLEPLASTGWRIIFFSLFFFSQLKHIKNIKENIKEVALGLLIDNT